MNIESQRERLIDAALGHVIFDGMNEAAIRAGAQDIGMDSKLAAVLLPQGGADLAAAYHRRKDTELAQWMETELTPGGIRDRIAQAVMHRLEISDHESVRAGAATLALPQHAPLATRLVWETADVIWTGLGDRSEDANWYSKRATLGLVHGATVLYWLGDDSEDYANTRDFLNRRLEGVMRIEKIKSVMRKLPGADRLEELATGWIRKPQGRDLPGRWWSRKEPKTRAAQEE